MKLPFSLTERFKQLTQQGIGVPALDTSYVSSGSWYMIAQTGLTRLLQLVDIGAVVTEQEMMKMQMQMPMGGGQAGQPFNAKTAFEAEQRELRIAQYSSMLLESERALLAEARAALPQGHRQPAAAQAIAAAPAAAVVPAPAHAASSAAAAAAADSADLSYSDMPCLEPNALDTDPLAPDRAADPAPSATASRRAR